MDPVDPDPQHWFFISFIMVPGTTGTLFLPSDNYFHLNSDPDPAFHFHADPDPAPLQSGGRDHWYILSLQDSIVSVHGPRTRAYRVGI